MITFQVKPTPVPFVYELGKVESTPALRGLLISAKDKSQEDNFINYHFNKLEISFQSEFKRISSQMRRLFDYLEYPIYRSRHWINPHFRLKIRFEDNKRIFVPIDIYNWHKDYYNPKTKKIMVLCVLGERNSKGTLIKLDDCTYGSDNKHWQSQANTIYAMPINIVHSSPKDDNTSRIMLRYFISRGDY